MAKYLETKSGSIEEAIKQVNEKSVSQAQQKAAGAALSAKRGDISPSELVGASKEMYDGMTEKELEDFAKTKHKDLPKKIAASHCTSEARQLKDPKKETMVADKRGKNVKVIDKKDLKKYLSKGYIQAEETELEEGYYDVVFKDKNGKVEKDGKGFKDKAKANRFADKGNKIKGVQGKYVVYHVKGKPNKVLEDLDNDDKGSVQKVADKLKQASQKHANQAKSLEKDLQDNLDKVNPNAVKKKFDDRKDKDIDNDGDVDSTDKYLHKRRKAISKAVAKEETDMSQIQEMIDKNPKNVDDAYNPVVNVRGIGKMKRGDLFDKTFDEKKKLDKMLETAVISSKIPDSSKPYNFKLDDEMIKIVNNLQELLNARKQVAKIWHSPQYQKKLNILRNEEKDLKEYNEIGTPEYTKHTLEVTPGQQDAEWDKQVNIMHKKANSMREAIAKVWGMKEGKSPFEKQEDKHSKKTMSGEKTTKVEVEPNIKK